MSSCSSHFHLFPSISSHFQPFHSFTAFYSHFQIFQPFTAISSPLQPFQQFLSFQAFPAIYSIPAIFSHLQPFPAISRNSNHFQPSLHHSIIPWSNHSIVQSFQFLNHCLSLEQGLIARHAKGDRHSCKGLPHGLIRIKAGSCQLRHSNTLWRLQIKSHYKQRYKPWQQLDKSF